MDGFEVAIGEDGAAVVTTHHGPVGLAQVLAAMAEEERLLVANPSIRFVVFDYRDATLAPLRPHEIPRTARGAASLLDAHPDLTLIGVVPEALDFGLARMFQNHVQGNPGSSPSPDRLHLVRTMEEARVLMGSA